jgi:hypothetical protein
MIASLCARSDAIMQVRRVWGKAVALPRYQSYDFLRQTTISCDFVRSMVALAHYAYPPLDPISQNELLWNAWPLGCKAASRSATSARAASMLSSDGENVCSSGKIGIYRGREARDPEIALLPSGRRRFDKPCQAASFDFKTRTGVLLGGTMPSDCGDRQSICSSCKTKVSFNGQTR